MNCKGTKKMHFVMIIISHIYTTDITYAISLLFFNVMFFVFKCPAWQLALKLQNTCYLLFITVVCLPHF